MDACANASAKVDQEYGSWLKWFHNQSTFRGLFPVMTSGWPSVMTACHKSDIDVNVLVSREKLDALIAEDQFAYTDHRDRGYITAHMRGDTFAIEVRFTIDPKAIMRTLTHRMNEIALGMLYPDVVAKVIALKTTEPRMKTEPAWVCALGINSARMDPYDRMAQPLEKIIAKVNLQK
jgi:hypothetical protein